MMQMTGWPPSSYPSNVTSAPSSSSCKDLTSISLSSTLALSPTPQCRNSKTTTSGFQSYQARVYILQKNMFLTKSIFMFYPRIFKFLRLSGLSCAHIYILFAFLIQSCSKHSNSKIAIITSRDSTLCRTPN